MKKMAIVAAVTLVCGSFVYYHTRDRNPLGSDPNEAVSSDVSQKSSFVFSIGPDFSKIVDHGLSRMEVLDALNRQRDDLLRPPLVDVLEREITIRGKNYKLGAIGVSLQNAK